MFSSENRDQHDIPLVPNESIDSNADPSILVEKPGHDESYRRLSRTKLTDLGHQAIQGVLRTDVEWRLSHNRKTLIGNDGSKDDLPRIPRTSPAWMHRVPRVEQIIGKILDNQANPRVHTGDNHNLLFKVFEEANHQKSHFTVRQADKRVRPEGTTASLLYGRLMEAQRQIYTGLTSLNVDKNGGLTKEQREDISPWASMLDPHLIRDLKELVVENWMEKTSNDPIKHKEGIPRAQLRSGNIRFLEPGIIAPYLGVSVEDWLRQVRGEQGVVPETVVDAIGHFISISDENLNSVCEAIQPSNEKFAIDKVKRKAAEVPSSVWRRNLGLGLSGYKREFNQDLLNELHYVSKRIDKEVEDSLASKTRERHMVPREEYLELRETTREKVIRDYLGKNASPEEIEEFRLQLLQLRLPSRRN